jgi:hypothetical protein
VNISGDVSWHKNRVFISEVFLFEELVFTESPFETWGSENSMRQSFASDLREEWFEPAARNADHRDDRIQKSKQTAFSKSRLTRNFHPVFPKTPAFQGTTDNEVLLPRC